MSSKITLIECPRDAMQGFHHQFSTQEKIKYIQLLDNVGFDYLDCASFVSSKSIPQMADSKAVLNGLKETKTKLLSIVANERGALMAAETDQISVLGYPFSISETFQLRNTNKSIDESLVLIEKIKSITDNHNKDLVIYLSMAFGNPYHEKWNMELINLQVANLANLGVNVISLSDTIGVANSKDIKEIFIQLISNHPKIIFGAHLHCKPLEWEEKLNAAFDGGCLRFDGAMMGFGGCPMATDSLTGNMPTEHIVQKFRKQLKSKFIEKNFTKALFAAGQLFNI